MKRIYPIKKVNSNLECAYMALATIRKYGYSDERMKDLDDAVEKVEYLSNTKEYMELQSAVTNVLNS